MSREMVCLTCGGDYVREDGDRGCQCEKCLERSGGSPRVAKVAPEGVTDGMAIIQLLCSGAELRWQPSGTSYRLRHRAGHIDRWLVERTPTGTEQWQPVCGGEHLPVVMAEYRALEEEPCPRN